jgi:hypothetical protein
MSVTAVTRRERVGCAKTLSGGMREDRDRFCPSPFLRCQRGFVKGHDFSRADKPRNSIDAPMRRNRPGAVSLERRMDFLAALGQGVQITVRPARRGQGAVSMSG